MQASIDFDGTLSGSIAGGGGGGSEVSITPTYNQGKKIADYSIDGNEGTIYIPEIEITKYVNSGVKLCEIEGVEIFAPSCGYIDTLGDSNIEQIGGFSQGANVTPVNVKRVSYTNDITNGEKIGSITVGDISYNVYQKVNSNNNNYSTDEKIIGSWMNTPLYRKVWQGLNTSTNGNSWITLSGVDVTNWDEIINLHAYTILNNRLTTVAITEYRMINGHVELSGISSAFDRTINIVYIEYTKNTD